MPGAANDNDPRDVLNDKERRLARIVAVSPDVQLWRAGWLSGYCNADPEGPEPDDPDARRNLAKSAKRALDRPRVQAEVARLRGLSAADVRERASTRDPVALLEKEAKERRLDALTADRDVIELGAQLLDLKLRAATADMGDYADWDAGSATVKAKDELTPEQRQLIRKLSFHPTCGKCGAEHATPGVVLELEPRATFAAQATKQLGLDAASKVEVAGKGGGPIQLEVAGLSWETLEAVRHSIIGRPPAAE